MHTKNRFRIKAHKRCGPRPSPPLPATLCAHAHATAQLSHDECRHVPWPTPIATVACTPVCTCPCHCSAQSR
ncbi:hypothetical protein C9890_0177 [Perkinsus sp. BL_2016]|nr:hypothetical protein C9890_0177 [Perkinsus sp. BL_2016]